MYDAHVEHEIQAAAGRHNLPPEIVRAIVAVESGGNPWAARYEPGYRWTIPKAKRPATCTQATEDVLQSMSLGPMQVMGAVARELGHRGWLTDLCFWEDGLEYGCAHLAKLKARYFDKHGWPGVVAAYNAGSPRRDASGLYVNQEYPDKVLKALGGEWPGEA